MSLPVLADSLQIYMADVNRFPVLSREEEERLAIRYYDKKDLEAAHALVTANLRLVVKIAHEYRSYGVNLKDLVQEGNLGLMTAVKKFNPYKGYRLITYAGWWIKAYIQEFILKTRGLVKQATKAMKKKLFYRGEEAGTDPTPSGPDLSLNTAIGDDDGKTHMDMLPDPGPGHEENIGKAQEQALVKRDVTDALAVLNEKERLVVERRLMAEEPLSLQAIGEILGLTRERVRQIEGAALKKLRGVLSEKAPPAALPA
ncbi:MAG: sigma-70 family RNA polymerase sigma factor [Thermodesulfobacteriota bacterium]